MQANTKLLCLACVLVVCRCGAQTEQAVTSVGQSKGHLRARKLKPETPATIITRLTWRQGSQWGVKTQELYCTSPGSPHNHIEGNAGFNVSEGTSHATPPLACSAETQWPYGLGYMTFTTSLLPSWIIAANFTDGLEVDQMWHASGTRIGMELSPSALSYNMNFEPSWSILYSYMVSAETTEFGVLKHARVGYGPSGWWIGSKDCKTHKDDLNGGLLFKCKVYGSTGSGDKLMPDKTLFLTRIPDEGTFVYSVVNETF